jgi:hypothetical protein
MQGLHRVHTEYHSILVMQSRDVAWKSLHIGVSVRCTDLHMILPHIDVTVGFTIDSCRPPVLRTRNFCD